MRKILFSSVVIIIFSSALHAQINKGSVFLGGGIGFSNTQDELQGGNHSSVSLTPAIGITINKSTVAGIQVSYSHSKNDIPPSAQADSKVYGAEIFLRKYLPLGKGFYLFGQTGLYYRATQYTYEYPAYDSKQKEQGIGINLFPGISYAITKKFHVELNFANLVTMEYATNKVTNGTDVVQHRKSVSLNANASSLSNLNIGFRFFLSKK